MWFLTLLSIINEVLPLAQLAVHAVQAAAPPAASSGDKLFAATKAVNDTINAASAGLAAFTQTKAAIDSGKGEDVAAAIGHSIEVALSVSKTFGLFPKAGVVQNAPLLGSSNDAPGS